MTTKRVILLAFAALLAATLASCKSDPVEPDIEPFDSDGASTALFSVNTNKQVRFARGNLQYQASTGTWRFAERQYTIVGIGNRQVGATYDGWIDLFCWGTSGWESGANCYQPYSTSLNNADYYPGGSYSNDLAGDYAEADWGVHNAIAGGGDRAGQWRTLNDSEWFYLLKSGGVRAGKRATACVCGHNGLVVLPDAWKLPEGLHFTAGVDSFDLNEYTADEWAAMEKAGAIFLPAAGLRQGASYGYEEAIGGYWSTSHGDDQTAYCLAFGEGMLYPADGDNRNYGLSVRLVKEAQ